MRLLPATPLLLVLLALGGCKQLRPNTPVTSYEDFHEAVQKGEYRAAYAILSQPTQQALQARAKTVADASGGTVKADPVAFFFANVPTPADVTKVSLTSEEGEVARVEVVSSAGKSEVRMVREPSGWKVDLTQSLQQP
jgi:hypothetical protein